MNLYENGASEDEVNFLLDNRVELNSMTSDQLVAFVERKLKQHGIKKVVPSKDKLAQAYRLFARSHAAEKIVRRELRKLNNDAAMPVPRDLTKRVRECLAQRPEVRWDTAVQEIAEAEATAKASKHANGKRAHKGRHV